VPHWGVRAIAIYSGAQMSGNCTPTTPITYYASHGTHLSVLCYESSSTGWQLNTRGGGIGLAQNLAEVDCCIWEMPTNVTSGTHVCSKLTDAPLGIRWSSGHSTETTLRFRAMGS